MRKIKHLHDVSELAKTFKYDAESGVLYRKLKCGERPCGTLFNTGHMQVYFDGVMVGVHRIAWALVHGEYLAVEIDHINGDGADNRLCNLRLATSSQNNQNRRISKRNKSGVKGVFRVNYHKWTNQKWWRVSVGHSRGKYHISHFHCFGQAVKHSHEMRAKLHGDFANLGVAA